MNKTVFITGASSGIGKATALYFAEEGWNVVATMRDPKKSLDFTDKKNILCLALDVMQPHTITLAVRSTIKKFGGIDVLVNNAGFGMEGPFEGATDQHVEDIFDTNVMGLMRVTRAILPHFRKNRKGIIINISSMAGRTTFPFYSLYHATKWAVEGFSESLRYELAPLGIRIKIIEPGVITTDFYRNMEESSVKKIPEDYMKYYNKTLDNKKKMRMMSTPASTAAHVIFQAATDMSSRLRYPVGIDAVVLTWARKFFPDFLYQLFVGLSMK